MTISILHTPLPPYTKTLLNLTVTLCLFDPLNIQVVHTLPSQLTQLFHTSLNARTISLTHTPTTQHLFYSSLQARAHRIGQTKPVKVYRLLTRKTYETMMFKAASIKLGTYLLLVLISCPFKCFFHTCLPLPSEMRTNWDSSHEHFPKTCFTSS